MPVRFNRQPSSDLKAESFGSCGLSVQFDSDAEQSDQPVDRYVWARCTQGRSESAVVSASPPPTDATVRRVVVVSDERCMHRGLPLPDVPTETLERMIAAQVESALPGEAMKRLQWGWARVSGKHRGAGPSPVWVLAIATDAMTCGGGFQDGSQNESLGGAAGYVSESMALAALVLCPSSSGSQAVLANEGTMLIAEWRGQVRALWFTQAGVQGTAVVDLPAYESPTAWLDVVQHAIDECMASAAREGSDPRDRPAKLAVLVPDKSTETLNEAARRLGMQLTPVEPFLGSVWMEARKTQIDQTAAYESAVDQILAAGAAVLAAPVADWALDKQIGTDGLARPGGLASVPVIGLDDAQLLAESTRRLTRRRLIIIAAAAVWMLLMLVVVIRQDSADAGRLGDAVADAGVTHQDEAALRQQMILYRFLEKQGPSPLAIVDEVGRLTKRYMVESFSFDASGQVRLTGKLRRQNEVAELVAALAKAKTLDEVRLKSQKKQGREVVFEILASPTEQFLTALVPEPSVVKTAETNKNADEEKGGPRGDQSKR